MGDDIVESIDGKRLAGIYNLDEWVYVTGQALKFVITRGDQRLEKTVIAGERPLRPTS